ncbi:MAG TPA: PH domain-containing protein [Mucilaginibacter sp.]|nr:PH domain-containing protein [Mucilaginibacter sp.]
MNYSETDIPLRPSPIFAFLKILPFALCTLGLLFLASRYVPDLIWPSLFSLAFGIYRYIFIRRVIYLVTTEYIRITKGIFFKQVDTVEMFRVKDYVITEPFLLQIFKLMDLHLKTTDPENPILWLRGIPQSDIVDIIRERVLDSRQHNRIFEIN